MNLTLTEKKVKNDFEKKGYSMLRNGHPDFVFYKFRDNKFYDIQFVEVKGKYNVLSEQQQIYRDLLKSLNINYKLIRSTETPILSYKDRQIKIKEEIIMALEKSGRVSTSRMAGITGIFQPKVKRLLEELVKEKKAKKIQETLATYWEINKK